MGAILYVSVSWVLMGAILSINSKHKKLLNSIHEERPMQRWGRLVSRLQLLTVSVAVQR